MISIRELQKALSSPIVASYHLDKLSRAGLMIRSGRGYVINRLYLKNYMRLKRFLIPRFFYSALFAIAFILQLLLFTPQTIASSCSHILLLQRKQNLVKKENLKRETVNTSILFS